MFIFYYQRVSLIKNLHTLQTFESLYHGVDISIQYILNLDRSEAITSLITKCSVSDTLNNNELTK